MSNVELKKDKSKCHLQLRNVLCYVLKARNPQYRGGLIRLDGFETPKCSKLNKQRKP